jgi:Autoinducer binding domain
MPTFQTVEFCVETSLADLLDALDQASTPNEVWNAGSKWMIAFGIEWYHYVYTRERWEHGGRQLVRYSSLPQAWMEHYGALGFFRVDPSIRHRIAYSALSGANVLRYCVIRTQTIIPNGGFRSAVSWFSDRVNGRYPPPATAATVWRADHVGSQPRQHSTCGITFPPQ